MSSIPSANSYLNASELFSQSLRFPLLHKQPVGLLRNSPTSQPTDFTFTFSPCEATNLPKLSSVFLVCGAEGGKLEDKG